jgi:ABC-2 type transport system permease protein
VAGLLFPGTVFLVVLIVAEGMSVEIWKERGAGAVLRLLGTPSGVHAFLAGKVAATSVVFTAAIALSFAAARFLFDVPIQAPGVALAWAAGCAVTFYLGLLVVELLLANERTALVVANMIVIPLAMLGGSFFPVEIMPETFARVARAVPNGWMLLQFKSIVTGTDAAPVVRPFAILLLAVVVAYTIAARLMARRLAA